MSHPLNITSSRLQRRTLLRGALAVAACSASPLRTARAAPAVNNAGAKIELTEAQLDSHAASNALGRLNEVDEVARAVVFIAGLRNVSGQFFQLDSRIAPWT